MPKRNLTASGGGVVVHFGVGNFHRAHQAWHIDAANRQAKTDWRILGVCPRRPTARDLLRPQNWRYHLLTEGGGGARLEKMNIHCDILVAGENPRGVSESVADSQTALATFTITEEGYFADDEAGIFRLIAAGLQHRRQNNSGGLTMLSCDNLPENGKALRAALLRATEKIPGLPEWTDKHCTFPSSMVDRIVPRTDDALRLRLRNEFDIADKWPVTAENFSQWVVEDCFASDRPALELGGAEIVADARPYENAKLTMLNGAHSLLAYEGIARGFCFMHEAAKDAALRKQTNIFWDEVAETVNAPPTFNLRDYRRQLMERFAAAAPIHRLEQIASDGSRKIAARWLPALHTRTRAGLAAPALCDAIAAWVVFCREKTQRRELINDPMAAQLQQAAKKGAEHLLGLQPVFGGFFDDHPAVAVDILRRIQLRRK